MRCWLHCILLLFAVVTPLEFAEPATLFNCQMTTNSSRLPTAFVSHGGGPSFFMDGRGSPFVYIDMNSEAKKSLERLPKQLGAERPAAIVVVTAHWEGAQVLVSGKDEYTKLFYDYSGFPQYTYQLEYKAPTNPKLASQIVQMLVDKGIDSKLDKTRDWDHGVFIPLKVMFPNADVPVIAVSILRGYDPSAHIAIGRALAPLRDQNVLILGSGFATHNFDPRAASGNLPFINAVTDAIAMPQDERERIFVNWTKLPGARLAHAEEDHLMPLHVVIGAAASDAGKELFRTVPQGVMGFVHWGFGV
jgi:aromatic ring-opening dioxygenase catalytic subunit (LigB family)